MEPELNETKNNTGYWPSVLLAGLIFGLISFALTIGAGYYTINAQVTTSVVNPSTIIGAITCLITAFGGMLAVWHYGGEQQGIIVIGRGALVGLLTGVVIAIIGLLLSNVVWPLIDPGYTDKIIDATIRTMHARGMTQEQIQKMTDMMHSGSSWKSVGYLVNVILFAFLNMITGMIGAKLFSKYDDNPDTV